MWAVMFGRHGDDSLPGYIELTATDDDVVRVIGGDPAEAKIGVTPLTTEQAQMLRDLLPSRCLVMFSRMT
jgi:hypothetical protein